MELVGSHSLSPDLYNGLKGFPLTFCIHGGLIVLQTLSLTIPYLAHLNEFDEIDGSESDSRLLYQKILRGNRFIRCSLTTIWVSRSGDPDGNQLGDLYVHIKVREDLSMSRLQAILRANIQVPTLTGDVLLKVRAWTQPGSKVVLKGEAKRLRLNLV
ncbi:hypothetical protein L1987_14568 [Smallanthus sonchifolius]|uniref:Uncharacterized protein n=1 Tax=Smallanthus sonchifolius TaxID=185202 RepID=A0ACB9J3P8_9ASTR|nr:hypothetical protein L1987_14568 [Smallanthus sonchifolius]